MERFLLRNNKLLKSSKLSIKLEGRSAFRGNICEPGEGLMLLLSFCHKLLKDTCESIGTLFSAL